MCQCGQPTMYDDLCRQCHEDKMRRAARDAYDQDSGVRTKMMLHKERCRVRLRKNYEGPSSSFKGT